MAKSRTRIFEKNSILNGTAIKREDAVYKLLNDIRSGKISKETKKFIELFGITAEELTEAGITCEEISLLGACF